MSTKGAYTIWIFRGMVDPYKLSVPRVWAKVALCVLTIAVCVSPFLTYGYLTKTIKLARIERERSEEVATLASLDGKLKEFRTQMHRLREFDVRLRVIASLESVEEAGPLLAVGGLGHDQHQKTGGVAGRMEEELNRLSEEAAFRERSFQELYSFLEGKRRQLVCTPSIRPVRGWLTSGFGYRRDPFTGLREFHAGVDISNRIGTDICTPADGMVSQIKKEFGLGLTLSIDHGYGFVTRYAHLSQAHVKVGQQVKRGQTIAKLGNSGRSTGPHLHYEVRLNGVPVNPLHYILN